MHARTRIVVLAALAALLTPGAARAQSGAIYGVAETSGDETTLFLVGASLNPGIKGWQPYVSANVYNIRFESGAGTIARNVFSPQGGLRFAGDGYSTQFGLGYSFTEQDFKGGLFNVPAETGEGAFVSFNWNHWGTGNRSLELLGSYGLKSNFLWSRARVMWKLTPESPIRAGVETGLLGDTESSPSRFTGQAGPAVVYEVNQNFRVNGGAGLKFGISGANNDRSDWYARVGFLVLPWAGR